MRQIKDRVKCTLPGSNFGIKFYHQLKNVYFVLLLIGINLTANSLKADAPIHRGKSGGTSTTLNRLYFPDDTIAMRKAGAQHLIVECANPTTNNLNNYLITLTLPEGYEIIDPSGRTHMSHFGRNMPTVSFQNVNNRQTVTLSYNVSIPPGDLDDDETYYSTLLVMRALPGAVQNGTLDYEFTADHWTGPNGSVSVKLLPDLPGKRNRPFMLMCPIVGFHANLNTAESEALLQTYKDAGFDTVHFTNYPQSLLDSSSPGSWPVTYIPAIRANAQSAKNLGLQIIYSNFMVWGRDYFEFDKLSQHQALQSDGTKNDRIPCPEWWIESGYLQHYSAMEHEMDVNFADIYLRDSEMNTAADYCFCTDCKEKFGEVKSIPFAKYMSSSYILSNFRSQWVDFRCRQYARISQRLKEMANQIRPDQPYFLYSGLQRAENKELYCIDWNYMGSACDWAVGTRGSIPDTLTALNGTPLMGRFGVYDFSPHTHLPIYVETFIDTGATGLRLFSALNYDGYILQKAALMSNIMDRFQDILKNHQQQNNLISLSGNTADIDFRVLVSGTGSNEARLFILMNKSDSDKEFIVNCPDAGAGWQAYLYPTDQPYGDGKTTKITLAPYDVKFLELTQNTIDKESLALNSSFESVSGSTFTNWSSNYNGYSISDSMSYVGDKSLKFEGHTTTFFAASQSVQVPKVGNLYPNLKISCKAYVETLNDCELKPVHVSWSSNGQSYYRSLNITPSLVKFNGWTEYCYILDELNAFPPDNDTVTFWTLSNNHGASGYIKAYIDDYIIEEAEELAANPAFEKTNGGLLTSWNSQYDGYSISTSMKNSGFRSLMLEGTTSTFLAASQAILVSPDNGIWPDLNFSVKYYVDSIVACRLKPIHITWQSGGQNQYRSVSLNSSNTVTGQWLECSYILDELNTYPPDNNTITYWILSDCHDSGSYIKAYFDNCSIQEVNNLLTNFSFEETTGTLCTAWIPSYDGYVATGSKSYTGSKSILLEGNTSTFIAASQSIEVTPDNGIYPVLEIKSKAFIENLDDCYFKTIHLSWDSNGRSYYRSFSVNSSNATLNEWIEYTFTLDELNQFPPDNDTVTFWTLSGGHNANSYVKVYVDDIKISTK